MATRTITTRLALDGEKEFKNQMASVNSALKEIRSEMDLSEAEFKGQANSVEALTEKERLLQKELEQQAEKVRALEQAVKDASEAYGDADKKTDNYRISLNKAKTELIKMQDALDDTRSHLKNAEDSADGFADSLDEFGNVNGGFLDDFMGSLSDLQGMLTGGIVVGGIQKVTEAMFDLEESTREYRTIMGTLESSSKDAGYTAEETKEAYERLYGVLGDTQTAATTVANLQAIGVEQEDLIELTDACTGAWSKYGDSIPIDGLAEAINETVRCGEVTGVLADVLNWGSKEGETFGVKMKEATTENEAFNEAVQDATTAEEWFNLALQDTQTESERAQLILKTLADQNLVDLGQEWRNINEDIIKVNESQSKLDEQWARMGEMVAPAVAALKEGLGKTLEGLLDGFENLISKTREWGQNAPTIREMFSGSTSSSAGSSSISAAESKAKNSLTAPIKSTGSPATAQDIDTILKNSVNTRMMTGTAQTIHLTTQTVLDGEVLFEKQEEIKMRNGKAAGK